MAGRSYRLSGGLFDREEEGTENVKRMVFLSVEGVRSEPSYFRHFNRFLRESGRKDVQIHVLKHPNDGLTSPADVYSLLEECYNLKVDDRLLPEDVIGKLKERFAEEEISGLIDGTSALSVERRQEFFGMLLKMGINLSYRKFLKEANTSDGDVFAVVIDRDQGSHSREDLDEIIQKCGEKSFLCCLTNPCFEFWLLLHLVDVEVLQEPDELTRILANKKLSQQHTYVSKRVGDLAGHSKKITWPKFEAHYKPKLDKALSAAKLFAGTEEDVLDRVGTMMPVLLDRIFKPICRE